MARILANKILENFDSFEKIAQIGNTTEFGIIVELEKLVDSKSKNIPEGSSEAFDIDYELVVSAWSELFKSISILNQKNKELMEYVKRVFSINCDDFSLSGTLQEHYKYIQRKIDSEWINTYKEYLLEINEIVSRFKVKILSYHSACYQDEFLDNCGIINKNNIYYEKIDIDGESAYLDNNVMSKFANNNQLLKLSASKNINFLYSAYTIEDAINSNPLFLKGFINDLMMVTRGVMVGYGQEGIGFVKEDINLTLERVSKYNELTKNAERSHVINTMRNYYSYPELRKGERLYNEIIEKGLINEMDSNKYNELAGISLVKSKFINLFPLSKLKNDDANIRDNITELSKLLDMVNYETEVVRFDNFQKIASSYRDREHLEHAYICDYFVTDDSKLNSRAKVIFDIIGSRTRVLTSKEFINNIMKV